MLKFLSYSLLFSLFVYCRSLNIQDLIQTMTVEDKCGQMNQITFDVIQKTPMPTDPDENPINETLLIEAIKKFKVGSILNTPYGIAQKASTWQKILYLIQSMGSKYGSKNIPILYGLDSIHGANFVREAVLFPQPLAMVASFNIDIAFRIGEITALETRAVGIPWNFNPVFDMGRQPLWPRIYETYGEDVFLASKMGEAYIKGSQGKSLKNKNKTATCMKCFIGYGFPFNGRDRSVAYIPENLLREVFLPPFEAGVLAGSPTVMINSGEVNDIPGHANGYYINDILKGELKFEGFVVSDWEDIKKLHTRDFIASSPEEAVRLAVMSGIDMSMVPFDYSFYDHCVNLTRKDQKFSARVDDAVKRILKVKNDLGLFEKSTPDKEDLNKIGTDESENFNLETARESIILAKNKNNLLPLDPSSSKKILVTGPSSNILRSLNGGWSYTWQGDVEENFVNFGRKKMTILESIKSHANSENLLYSEGANFTDVIDIDDAVSKGKDSDIIILCIGEDTYAEGVGNIDNLIISDSQIKLSNALLDLKKPTVILYIGGRPRIITDIVESSDAVLLAFLPGNKGSNAIGDILFGKFNPDAKLPITYPRNTNGFSTYDRKPLDEFDFNKYQPLFPFGHGLSYTKFEYLSIRLSKKEIKDSETLTVTVQVKNIGELDGKEIVILYLRDLYGSVSRPIRQVKGFQKISLKKNEIKTVEFKLNKNDFSFIGKNNKRIVESGEFHVFVGSLNETFYINVDDSTSNQFNNIGSSLSISLIPRIILLFYLFYLFF